MMGVQPHVNRRALPERGTWTQPIGALRPSSSYSVYVVYATKGRETPVEH
jgi:hypothetical protein